MTSSDLPLIPPLPSSASASRKLQARRLSLSSSKGKQRELSPLRDIETHPPPPPPDEEQGRRVTIRFTGGGGVESDLEVWVESRESVGRVKDKIRSLRPSIAPSTLRLIHSGRLLTDGILLLPWLRSLESRHRRQAKGVSGDVGDVLRDVGLAEEREEDEDREEERIWLHCVVGEKFEDGKGEREVEGNIAESSIPRRRGFDALLDAGLSPLEVAQMRRQFYAGRGEEVPEGIDGALPGSVEEEHARALEEQWIEGDLTVETATTSGEGLYTSTLQGLITGFLFPLLPFSFFREPPVPDFFHPLEEEPAAISDVRGGFTLRGRQAGDWVVGVAFGPRMQGAIFLGTVLNIAFGALRFLG